MSDNNSWNAGISGQAPGAGTDWNSYSAGKSIRDMTQAELSRQNASPGASDALYPSGGGWLPGGKYIPRVSLDPDSPLCAPRKSYFLGVLLTVFMGPVGLFYSSKTGAVILLIAVGAAVIYAAPDLRVFVWQLLGALASVIWTVLAISVHNRRAAATDAKNLDAWEKSKTATPAAE